MNRHRVAVIIVAVVATTLISLGVFADVVRLKNGRTLEGKIVSRDAQNIVLDTGVQKVTVRLSMVDSVESSAAAVSGKGETLAEARGLAKAGLLERAFESYQAALADPALSEETRKAALAEKRAIMKDALDKLRGQYKGLIEDGDYELCLKRVGQERARVKPGSFESQVRCCLEAEMRAFLAEACMDRSDYNGALGLLEESAKFENLDCPYFDVQFGAVLLRMGSFERAAKHLLRATECFPKDHAVLRNLYLAFAQSGKADEAAERYLAHTATCPLEIWDSENSRETFGKACRRTALERVSKTKDEPTFKLYNLGMEHSPISVPLYEEAIRFYSLAGLSGSVAEMTRLRDDLQDLKAQSILGARQREADGLRRMAQIRTTNKRKSDQVREEVARDAALRQSARASRTYGSSSSSGFGYSSGST